ncbi:FISUMP domain-containing protein [Rhodocytophaga aerolata]|uniref:FISUMP domain-containing protein n=1 Tax=Rhodocytophaga aerolata TaxID=455078 RepID=A0ABT8RCV4_9BACT|nr:FISUMP domain-containing protein [Rhodocytophaga aerolata]MDO1449895.1 FISUMP domain-containing protein [Rhodocytophaga aerolata]
MNNLFSKTVLYVCFALSMLSCEEKEAELEIPGENNSGGIETPVSAIPQEYTGTWYAEHNQGPLSKNWEEKTFQGEQGWKEFRTLVITRDGKNAVEYTTKIMNVLDEVKQYSYKISGTLTYHSSPSTITFHAQRGKMRVFINKYAGYKESDISLKDLENYKTVLAHAQATTYTTSQNFLTAKRLDGGMEISARYLKADGSSGIPGDGGNANPYSVPPASGTYVQMGNHYYPTVKIGKLEWMSVNYAGPGGIKNTEKPQYGTFLKHADLEQLQIPAGWRIPTKKDFLDLLDSQGIEFNEVWGTTDGSDLESKKRLGYLMATTGWLKRDGFANNRSGFNAVPGNLMVSNGNPHGEGTNCLLWTSEIDEEGNPVSFRLIQLPSDTYASFGASVTGFNPPHIPLRLVKDL